MYGAAIKTQRDLRSMKQSELAVLLGVSDSAISRYEAGIRDVPEMLQHAIALVFGVDVDRLFPVVRVDDRLARSA